MEKLLRVFLLPGDPGFVKGTASAVPQKRWQGMRLQPLRAICTKHMAVRHEVILDIPQGLNAPFFIRAYGTAEAVPLTKFFSAKK